MKRQSLYPRQSSQNTVLVSAFLALIVLLLAGYLLKKRHEKPPEIILFFRDERERYLLQPESPIKDAVFSEETETDSAEDIVEISELSSEQFAEKSEGTPDTDRFTAEDQV